MENGISTFNQALILKSLGFNEWCFDYYNTIGVIPKERPIGYRGLVNNETLGVWHSAAPRQSHIRNWINNNHKLSIIVKNSPDWNSQILIITKIETQQIIYESQLKADITKCIEILIDLALSYIKFSDIFKRIKSNNEYTRKNL